MAMLPKKVGFSHRSILIVCLFISMYVLYIGFLESVNNMLTSGMVPALFPDDEKEAVIGQVFSPFQSHF